MPAMGSIRSNTPPSRRTRTTDSAAMPTSSTSAAGTAAHQPRLSFQEDPQPGRDRRRHRERQGEERRVRHDHQHVLPERLDASGPIAAEVHPRGKEERGPVVDQHAQKVDARQADGRRGQHRGPDVERRIQIGDADERDVRDEQQPELHAGEHQGGGGGLRRDDRAAGQRVAPEQVELEEVTPRSFRIHCGPITSESAAQVVASQPAISASVPSPWNESAPAATAPTTNATAMFRARRVRTTASRFFQSSAPPRQPTGAS